ncbi:MAG: hypothetical protein R2691_09960 [Solirubrobacterales bacterium]
MATPDEIKAEVSKKVEAGRLLDHLADRIGSRVGASAVFGQPVEREGVTVIGVARAMWGFGGGAGGEEGEDGAGGGGGGFVSPLGYIEVRESGAEFRPIRDPRLVATAAAATVCALGLLARGLRRR